METEAERDQHETESETNQQQSKLVAELRASVQAQHPAAKELDDSTFRRFLQARNLNVEKASAMMLKYVKWRKEAVPNGFISDTEVPNQIAQNKFFTQGFDRAGRPIVVLLGVKHFKGEIEEFKRFSVYCLDRVCARLPSDQEKFLCISDLKGWGYSNLDIRGYLAALDIMQNYYPERLGKVLLINVPFVFMKIWKIISPFIDKNTKKSLYIWWEAAPHPCRQVEGVEYSLSFRKRQKILLKLENKCGNLDMKEK
ncbi:Sec14p-like phosphatidylinositol transfer family protein [Rhynchospora pubera]|uniref:Sec14p-like phosphatidylinositol transfer family protein n=1 Tax=Rhynchospora pubera TaxID=906938 RepID=A0AAV8C294_9POAL|nr:Sec14p-like phosphatidylinositol transfer family protein [Rhynchospora pubera]